ncbi:MAG: glycosyltransferase [Verrucomicrobiota bacterium]
MHPTLALCMILRNEEASLPSCLDSVAPAVDAIYLTDTGSTDHTLEIARRFGAHIRHFTWCDDFSSARNASIANVAEDWILFLDADDYFPPGEAARLRNHLADDTTDGTLLYHVIEGHTPSLARRLFRNHLGLRFEGIIHESIRRSLVALPNARTHHTGVHLQHRGYHPASLPQKLLRNLPLLEREWQRCQASTDFTQRTYVGKELAHASILLGRVDEGLTLLNQLIDSILQRGTAPGDVEIAALATLLWFFDERGQTTEALALCRRVQSLFAPHPAFPLYRGLALARAKEFSAALEDLNQFERNWVSGLVTVSVPEAYTNLALWDLQGQCFLHLGAFADAAARFEKCAAFAPDREEYAKKLHLARSLMR